MEQNGQQHHNGQNGKSLFKRLCLLLNNNPPNIGQTQLVIKREFGRQYPDFFITGEQVQLIWENVPNIFPEDTKKIKWKYKYLKNRQKKVYKNIAEIGQDACPIPVIKKVITIGLQMEKANGHLLLPIKNGTQTDSG